MSKIKNLFLEAILKLYKSLRLPHKVRQTLNRIINKLAFHKAQKIRAFSGSIDLSDFSIKATPLLYQTPNFDKNWDVMLSQIEGNLSPHKRFSHIIALPFFSLGGAQRVAFETAKALASFPQHTVLVIGTDKTLSSPPENTAGVTFLDLARSFPESSEKQRGSILKALIQTFQIPRLHNINSEIVWDMFLTEGHALKEVTSLYASIFAIQFDASGQETQGYARKFLKPGLEHVKALLTDNECFIEMAQDLLEISEAQSQKMKCIYNPIMPVKPKLPEVKIKKLRENWIGTQQSSKLHVCWAGRLDEGKRIDVVLETARQCPEFTFHLFGEQVLHDTAADPLNNKPENIIYQGPFTPSLIPAFEVFDAFMFTSIWEGLPNILLEVGQTGLPITAPLVGGVGELITEERGFPLPSRAMAENYSRALREIEENPALAIQRAKALKNLIKKRHSHKSFQETLTKIEGYCDV